MITRMCSHRFHGNTLPPPHLQLGHKTRRNEKFHNKSERRFGETSLDGLQTQKAHPNQGREPQSLGLRKRERGKKTLPSYFSGRQLKRSTNTFTAHFLFTLLFVFLFVYFVVDQREQRSVVSVVLYLLE